MTDYAALVTALKQGRTWEQVADICADGRRYDPMYYWKIAHGKIANPGAKARRGIVSASRRYLSARITRLNAPPERESRGGLTCRRSLWLRLRELKLSKNWTWDQLLEKAYDLMLREHGEESEE